MAVRRVHIASHRSLFGELRASSHTAHFHVYFHVVFRKTKWKRKLLKKGVNIAKGGQRSQTLRSLTNTKMRHLRWRDEKQHRMNLTSDLPSSGETVSSLKVFAKKQTNKWHLKWKLRACGYKAFVIYLVFKGLSCEDASSERVSGWVTRNAHVKNRWSCRKSQQSRLEMCKIIIHPLTHHFWHFQQTRFWKTTNQEFGSFWKISTFEVVQPTPDIPPTVVEEQKCKFAVAFADFCFYSVQCAFSFERTDDP